MFTNIFIYVAGSLGMIVLWSHKKVKYAVTLACIGIFALLIVAAPIAISHNNVVQGADKVASYHDAQIYYDEVDDEYFIVEQTNWNPIVHFVRYEVDQNVAIELVEAYEAAQKIPYTNIIPK